MNGENFLDELAAKRSDTGPTFQLVRAADLKPRAPQWLIRGLLETETLALLFADPNVGKSFLALDWLCCITTGKQWHGNEVKQRPAVYVCGEGQNGVSRRLRAWQIRHGVDLSTAPLFVSTGPGALSDPLAFVNIESAIDAVAEEHGKPGIVVIDTVARNFGPGDENSTRDMTAFIAAADALRVNYGATVLLVHHTGHADKTRARGAMALKGALDAEYRLDRDELGTIRLEATKMKDASYPDPLAFRLATVELGIFDEDGEQVTSCVLDPTGYEPPPKKNKAGRGKWQTVALEALADLHARHRGNLEESGLDPSTARVSMQDWRDECLAKDMPRNRFADVKESLINAAKVTHEHGYVS